VISSDVQSRKPDEKIYKVLIGRLQSRQIIPQQCIFIDDRLKNLKTAKDLGTKTIHLKKEEDNFDFQPDFTIRTLREIKEIL
jgi:FMN phosphatase YigB (HAD superfamily)